MLKRIKDFDLTDAQIEKIANAIMWAQDFAGAIMVFAIPAMIAALFILLGY